MNDMNRTEARLITEDIPAGKTSPAIRSQEQSGIERENGGKGNADRLVAERNVPTNERNLGYTPAMTADQQVQDAGPATLLFSDSDIGDLRSRWSNLQAEFVDEPRRAVEGADQLVATVMQRLAEGFAKERDSLEKQWDSGETASTEDLRMALQHYRVFFNRLLNVA
jgi:hypothetical protein